ncbi:protein of unknown function [Pseudomonas sp. JV241A]|nr:protein of unknown function [Pseudomonas sp. JV241A]
MVVRAQRRRDALLTEPRIHTLHGRGTEPRSSKPERKAP